MRTGQISVPPQTTPWAGMTPAQIHDFIEGAGGLEAAADYLLSRGHSENYAKNQTFRETGLQGRAIDEDRDDLSKGVRVIERRRRGGVARGVDIDQWNAVLALAPHDLKNRDVLIASARHGFGEVDEIAREVGRTSRRVRQIQDQIWAWAAKHLNSADLSARLDDPISQELVIPRPPSKAGRKPRAAAAAPIAPAPQVDLFGEVVVKWKPSRRQAGPRRACRVPGVQGHVQGQMDLFAMAA